MYSLNILDYLHSLFFLQLPSTSLCGRYCIIYIYCRSYNYSLSDNVDLLTDISSRDLSVKQYMYNMQNPFRILNPGQRTGQLCKLKCQFF